MRGGGRGGRKVRPTLPFKLTKELDGGDRQASRGGGRGHQSKRKDRRKEEREAKKHKPRPQFTPKHESKPSPGASMKRAAPGSDSASLPPSKKQRSAAQPVGSKSKQIEEARKARRSGGSRFDELLPAAEDPETVLQRELARKLGLKKGKKFGGDDGMDELLEELGGIEDILESGSEDENGKSRKKQAKGEKKGYTAAAPSESEEESGGDIMDSDNDSEEYSSDDDSDDGHLGGLSELDHEHDDLGFDLLEEDSEEEESDGDLDKILEDDSEDEEESESEGESDGQDQDSEEESESEDLESKDLDVDSDSEEERRDNVKKVKEMDKSASAVAGAVGSGAKYVPPAVRRAQLAAAGRAGGADVEEERIVRRVRGLLNRLAETNLPGIVGELSELYQSEGRSVVGNAVASELLTAAAEGPRASDRFAAVAAAAISGLAGLSNSSAVIAIFVDKVAGALESAMSSETEDSLASGNLVQVIAHLFLSGAVKPDLVFSLLDEWRTRFHECDVVAMAGLLSTAGLALRAADPEQMKAFVVAVHARAAECSKNGTTLSTRARVMLDLVVDIKNNRKREDGRRKAVALDPAAAKWLRSCHVGTVALGGITWKKVLTADKRGNWWMPTAADAAAAMGRNRSGGGNGDASTRGGGAAAAAAGVGSDAGIAAPELLKLASAMKMNTDSRRAVFCAVMGSEDAVDAFEKLLRLGLKGDQEREIVRVTVECCLFEKSYNPYYSQLLIRLCTVSKAHRMTLQYCLWDHFKEVPGMDVRRMTNLARLTAAAIASFTLPATILKAVDFAEVLSARETLFWRLFFEHCFAGCKTDADVATIFAKIGTQQQLGTLKIALGAFLMRSVGPWLAGKDPLDPGNGGAERLELLLRRCRVAERALLGKL